MLAKVKFIHRPNWTQGARLLLILVLLLPALLTVRATNPASTAVVQPALLKLAAQQPDTPVRVIVQKIAQDDTMEQTVARLGGQVIKDLHIINAFAAYIPAGAVPELAREAGVRWISLDAPIESAAKGGGQSTAVTIRDEFNAISYGGNEGSVAWDSPWYETGEPTKPDADRIRVRSDSECTASNCVRIEAGSNHHGLVRQANLSGASTATLTFDYSQDNEGGTVAVQISADGGATWTTLQSYVLNADQTGQSATFDVTSYASDNTQVRFLVTHEGDGRFWLDNVQIAFFSGGSNAHGSGKTGSGGHIGDCTACPANYFLDTLDVQPVWDMGLDGTGIAVAVIDSGISPDQDFTKIRASASFNASSTSNSDVYGHGTHVAGIIAGNGYASYGLYRGIAPGVDLISLKIADGTGMAYESDTVAAMQWVLDHKDQYNIRVVNMSINSTQEQSYHTSPLDAAAEILWFNRIVVVVSAGNKGPGGGPNSIDAAPANDPFVITVGASEEHGTADPADDTVAPFSAFGTTMDGFVKPEIIAPGRDIVSVLAKQSSWEVQHPDRVVGGEYFRASGTSMAAPMVAGAAALLLQDEPELTPDQVKYRLLHAASSTVLHSGNSQYTYPYLNVYAAVTGTTTESANTGRPASQLLWGGSDPVAWGSVNWGSVNWGSVNWGSVNWGSVNWGSVNWGSVDWSN